MILTSFLLGMLHALEPGHGKGAMAAIAFSHELKLKSILIFSFFNFLTHTFFAGLLSLFLALTFHNSNHIKNFLMSINQFLSWAIIFAGVVVFLIAIKQKKAKSIKTCCDENYAIVQKQINNPKKLFILAFTIGLVPCPTAIISLISGITTGSMTGALWSVMLFGLGVSFSLLFLLIIVNKTAKKLQMISGQMFISQYYLHIQGLFILLIGLLNL
jgi:ABC-type nickel/cobalt efflux system permease component RcnA